MMRDYVLLQHFSRTVEQKYYKKMADSSSPSRSKLGPPAAFEVHYVPKEFRLDASSSDYGEEDDTVWVTSVGDPFMYVIPSFDVIAVELRRMQIKGFDRRDDKEVKLDLFIRNDACLCRMYPSMMAIKDVVIIKVTMYIMQYIIVFFL